MAASLLKALPDVNAAAASSGEPDAAACLLASMARGEAAALETLYRLWSPSFMGIALKILTDRTDAEECLQDAFVRVWRKAGDYEPDRGSAFVWAFGILRGVCLDRLRYRSRQKRGGGSVMIQAGGETAELAEGPRVIAADDLRQVREVMAAMDPAERECLQLAVLLEYSHTEIAARLNTPLGTVKHRLRRALTKLRALFPV